MRVPNRFRALLMFFNSLRKKVWQSGISTRLDEDVDDFAYLDRRCPLCIPEQLLEHGNVLTTPAREFIVSVSFFWPATRGSFTANRARV